MDIVGHPGISKIIVHIQTTAEHAVLDLHLASSSLGTILCSVGRRSPHRGRIGICKLNIVNSQLTISGIHAVITASHIRLDIAVSQLCLCAVRIVHTDDAVAGTENLMIASHSAVDLITAGL